MSENDPMLNLTELKDIIWARFPTGTTDLEVGPHGFLYVVTAVLYAQGNWTGAIHRTVPE